MPLFKYTSSVKNSLLSYWLPGVNETDRRLLSKATLIFWYVWYVDDCMLYEARVPSEDCV